MESANTQHQVLYLSMTVLRYLQIHSSGGSKKIPAPILSCLAQKYLCIPATEAPSERIFSTASLLLSKPRNQRDRYLADRMVFFKKFFEWCEEFLQKKASEGD
jgi:hypothetical protein